MVRRLREYNGYLESLSDHALDVDGDGYYSDLYLRLFRISSRRIVPAGTVTFSG